MKVFHLSKKITDKNPNKKNNLLLKNKKQIDDDIIPSYNLIKPKKEIPKKKVICIATALTIISSIYLPPAIIDEVDTVTRASVNLQSMANANAMEWAINYLRNNPEADFDKDGLTNEEELNYNTGIYVIDNDSDGVTDYAELYLMGTNPAVYDNSIEKFAKQADIKTGQSVNVPFQLHGITLWADDYTSKARGGVIQLTDGSYNFYKFKGWVQFPENINFAYKVENNVQTPLKQNDSGYFYIDTAQLTNVRVYENQPEKCHILYLMGEQAYTLPDNIATKALSFILPSKGFGLITCKAALANDVDGTWSETSNSNKIVTLNLGEYDHERFNRDQRNLSDLADIFNKIDNQQNVIISLMSHEFGEVILEVYGYTNKNNLLVCDPETGEDFGIINVKVIEERVLDQTGNIVNYDRFTFKGCGYSSSARHRIMILDTVDASEDINDTSEELDKTTETNTDTNIETDPQPSSTTNNDPTTT